MGDAGDDTISLIEACLARLAAGDEGAWNDLISYAFNRLLAQCGRILRTTLSRPNPMITENTVLAESYTRLETAFRNDKVQPRTAMEFFGLAARNIRWQVKDMLRRRSAAQSAPDLLDGLPAGPGVSTVIEGLEQWRLFWDTANGLSGDEQQVFDLLFVHELSQYEAAAALGLDRNKVDTIWRRIKLKIGKACKDYLPMES